MVNDAEVSQYVSERNNFYAGYSEECAHESGSAHELDGPPGYWDSLVISWECDECGEVYPNVHYETQKREVDFIRATHTDSGECLRNPCPVHPRSFPR